MESSLMERPLAVASEVFVDEYAEHVARVYDEMAVEYDDIREPYFYLTYEMYDKFLVPLMEREAKSRQFDRVLDIGCGSGLQMYRLQRLAKEVVGIDISEGMLNLARRKFRHFKHITFERGDATALPYADASFDFVNSYGEVFSHIGDYARAFSEVSRVLKPGGAFAFDIDNKWEAQLLYEPKELWRSLRAGGDVVRDWEYVYETRESVTVKTTHFTHQGLEDALGAAGLKIETFTGCHILSNLLPYKYQTPLVSKRLFSVGQLGLVPELCMHLGKMDQAFGRHWPLNRLGFTKVVFARKA